MIAEIFFSNAIDEDDVNSYSSENLIYFLTEVIFKNNKCDMAFLINSLEEKYKIINHGKARKFIDKNFVYDKGFFVLLKEQEENYKKTKKFRQDLFYLEWESEKELYEKINTYISELPVNYIEGLSNVIALLKKTEQCNNEYCLSLYFDYLMNYNNYIIEIDNIVSIIDESYNRLNLNVLINNRFFLELLFSNGINTIYDLKKLSKESLFIIFSLDYKNLIMSIKPLTEDFITTYKEKINDLFIELKGRELNILSYRNGLNGHKKHTLEQIGAIYNFTRERCRQIEANAERKILSNINSIRSILINLYLNVCTSETRYISEDALYEYINNEKIYKYVLYLYEKSNLDIVYNSELKVIYNSLTTSLEDICNEVIETYDDILSLSDYDYLSSFEKSVINYSYKLYKDKIFVKKGIGTKELISLTIDEIFPNGYRIGSEEDYIKLESTFISKFGISDDFPSNRSIVGFLDRLNYCQVDKGTYKNRNYCISLPDELKNEIINYILLNQPTIFYSSIYEKYKQQLNFLGVNNYYYLKGLIDQHLPEEFDTKRNYISLGEKKTSSYESIKNYMKSFNGIFSLNDLRQKFLGVKDYTFLNVIYNEIENDLIALKDHRFIYISKIVITEQTIKDFKQFIEGTFNLMDTSVISSRKIYARLSLLNKDLLNRLKIVDDSFSTFSLIYHYFKDNYGFNRPLISLNKDENVNQYILITNHISNLESFNLKTLKNYSSKMNIRNVYSYLDFMEEQSDNFVQVNIDTMISKEKFDISESNLKEVEKMLELIFSRFESIDTRKFNGYAMLPKLKYLWNKYLLVGIIRSYLDEFYEIENTEATYDTTDFIIRRIK